MASRGPLPKASAADDKHHAGGEQMILSYTCHQKCTSVLFGRRRHQRDRRDNGPVIIPCDAPLCRRHHRSEDTGDADV